MKDYILPPLVIMLVMILIYAAISAASKNTNPSCKSCGCSSKNPEVDRARVQAILYVADAFSDITGVFFEHAKIGASESEAGTLRIALKKSRQAINRSEILFDTSFRQDMDRFYELFRQLASIPVGDWHKYRTFVGDLYCNFDDVCHERIGRIEGKPFGCVRMMMAPITYGERLRMTPQAWLDEQIKFAAK